MKWQTDNLQSQKRNSFQRDASPSAVDQPTKNPSHNDDVFGRRSNSANFELPSIFSSLTVSITDRQSSVTRPHKLGASQLRELNVSSSAKLQRPGVVSRPIIVGRCGGLSVCGLPFCARWPRSWLKIRHTSKNSMSCFWYPHPANQRWGHASVLPRLTGQ